LAKALSERVNSLFQLNLSGVFGRVGYDNDARDDLIALLVRYLHRTLPLAFVEKPAHLERAKALAEKVAA
jgi:hypothetical protein